MFLFPFQLFSLLADLSTKSKNQPETCSSKYRNALEWVLWAKCSINFHVTVRAVYVYLDCHRNQSTRFQQYGTITLAGLRWLKVRSRFDRWRQIIDENFSALHSVAIFLGTTRPAGFAMDFPGDSNEWRSWRIFYNQTRSDAGHQSIAYNIVHSTVGSVRLSGAG